MTVLVRLLLYFRLRVVVRLLLMDRDVVLSVLLVPCEVVGCSFPLLVWLLLEVEGSSTDLTFLADLLTFLGCLKGVGLGPTGRSNSIIPSNKSSTSDKLIASINSWSLSISTKQFGHSH